MSRVVYTDTPTTAEQEALRALHSVRLVTDAEEGMGVNVLPGGVFGFTYSPTLPNAPIFAARRFRSYETHKLDHDQVFVVGFASPETAALIETAADEITVVVQPHPDDEATMLVKIPYSRIRHHRQYAAPNQHGFTVTLQPAF